jgi:hypothetical protein
MDSFPIFTTMYVRAHSYPSLIVDDLHFITRNKNEEFFLHC